jgi:hypothetical protein
VVMLGCDAGWNVVAPSVSELVLDSSTYYSVSRR